MITLSLLKFLENEGKGTIDVDLFFEKLPLNKTGVYITSIGQALNRGGRKVQNFELFSRGSSDVESYKKLLDIGELLEASYSICELPAVPPVTEYGYRNITVEPTSTIANVGVDDSDRVVYSITGRITY